ncbi:hypothetical protein [Klebsiella pneumoniae ISC21]|nr:hypothetical protein [Klebsiella pneumoniae ISC21]
MVVFGGKGELQQARRLGGRGERKARVLLGYRRGCRFYCGQGVHQDRSSL